MPDESQTIASPADQDAGTLSGGEGRRRRRLRFPRWLRLPVSLTLLALLFSQIDFHGSLEIVRNARPEYLFLAFLLYPAERILAAYRWQMLLGEDAGRIGFGRIVRILFTSTFLGHFLPGGVGVEVLRVYGMTKTSTGLAKSVASVIVERVLALLALAVLILTGIILFPPGLPAFVGTLAWLWLATLVLGIVVVMNGRTRIALDILLSWKYVSAVRVPLARLYQCLDAYRDTPWLMVWAMAMALVFQLYRVFMVVAVAWGLGLDIPVVDFLVMVPIINLVSQVPVSMGGLGVREASFVSLFGIVGVGAEPAFTLSLVFYAFMVLSVSPGAWFYARHGHA